MHATNSAVMQSITKFVSDFNDAVAVDDNYEEKERVAQS
jgi:hypothetical protein